MYGPHPNPLPGGEGGRYKPYFPLCASYHENYIGAILRMNKKTKLHGPHPNPLPRGEGVYVAASRSAGQDFE